MKRHSREISLKKALVLALLLHVAALAVLTRLSLAEARSGSLEEIRVFGGDTPMEMATVSVVARPAPETTRLVATAEPPDAPVAAPDNSEEWTKPEPRTVRTHPTRSNPSSGERPPSPRPRSDPRPTGGASGATTPGGPLDLGPPSNAGTVPVPTSNGAGTPPGTIPGEGSGRGAGSGAGNGNERPGGTGGTGTGSGSGSGNGPGSGESGTEGDAPKHHSRLADQEKPVLIRRGKLVYPEAAIADGAEGTCVLKVLVGETGEVLDVEITQRTGDRRLDQAAVNYVRQFKYRPAVQNGEARRVATPATVRFELK